MRGREVQLHSREETGGPLFAEHFSKGLLLVRVQVVKDKMDAGGGGMFFHAIVPKKIRRINCRAPQGHGHGPGSRERCDRDEDVPPSVALVFIVKAVGLPRCHRAAPARRPEELFGRLIEATQDLPFGQWLRIEREDVIHALPELGRELRNAPHFFSATA